MPHLQVKSKLNTTVFATEIINKGERNKNETKSDAFDESFCYRNDVGLELKGYGKCSSFRQAKQRNARGSAPMGRSKVRKQYLLT